jgi:hypothetical protein
VRVQSLGTDAEQPTRGVQITAIVKSGGNQFHGGGVWSGASKSLEATNVDAALEAIGITSGDRLDSQSDVSGELGAASSGTSCGSTRPRAGATPPMTC